jgi:hypothetical protein
VYFNYFFGRKSVIISILMKKLLLILAVISLISIDTYGQEKKGTDTLVKFNTWSATLSGGSMLFYGDLRQYSIYPVGNSPYPKDISERKWGFGLAINKQLHPAFAVQVQFQKGKLSGFKRQKDAYFITSFTEYGINGIVNFRNLFFPNFANQKISVYGILGIGFVDFKSLQNSISTGEEIHSFGYGLYGQKKINTTEIVIPTGLGVKYKINNQFDIGLECILNNVNTDKLDAREIPGSKKDKYGYTCLTLTYKIGKGEKSLEWDVDKAILPIPTSKDSDNDGVVDKKDKCPNTPSIASVDANGCPFDSDGDSVADYMDKCPGTPKGVKTDSVGCPIDTDGDGVADYLDKCPDTPKEAKVDADGCPIDTDGDGVADYLDKCPDTPKEAKVDADGCTIIKDTTNLSDSVVQTPKRDFPIFRIQILAGKNLEVTDPEFKGLKNIYKYYHNGIYKYTWGETPLMQEALELQKQMQEAGFPGAFIVPFDKNNNRITLEEVK